jgi:alkanesulfonate monooxygenase SsuD/methylene tetrahydromethanopterin reductase-like flavin-dependent oxidoreductase (luciferase family)
MKIGIGLPNSVPGTSGQTMLGWARLAETRGFSTLGTIGRIAYPTYDSLIALAAAAGATERIGLMTDILLGPTYQPVVLAKMAASLDQLSGGRFRLGVSVGSREDDYELVGVDYHRRGRLWDEALELLHRAWRGERIAGSSHPITPRPTNGESVPIMVGGNSDAALRRVPKWGVGWTVGGGAAPTAAPLIERVRAAWQEAGRPGQPQITALAYFGLGEQADVAIREYISSYYEYIGAYAVTLAERVPRTPAAIRETIRAFEEIGVDELIFFPTSHDLEQVTLLAEAAL